MKLFTLIISLLILSCNSQKKATKEKEVEKNNTKTEVVETIKTNSDTTKTVTKTEITTQTNTKNTVKNNTTTNQKPQVEVLAEGSHGGYETSKYLVIKDDKALQEVYAKINMIRRPGIPVPKIDWKNEMVIALFMGQKNYGGYKISVENIKSINQSKDEITVKETAPQGIATAVITQPFYFCKVKRTDKDIVFKKVE